MTALTEADADADLLGLPRPDNPSLHAHLGLGTARGDILVPGERCDGPCGLPLAAGEPYTTVDGAVWCLACAACAGTAS